MSILLFGMRLQVPDSSVAWPRRWRKMLQDEGARPRSQDVLPRGGVRKLLCAASLPPLREVRWAEWCPQRYDHVLMYGTCECYLMQKVGPVKRVMKGLEMRRSSWIIRKILNAITGHLERVRQRESKRTPRRAVSVKT